MILQNRLRVKDRVQDGVDMLPLQEHACHGGKAGLNGGDHLGVREEGLDFLHQLGACLFPLRTGLVSPVVAVFLILLLGLAVLIFRLLPLVSCILRFFFSRLPCRLVFLGSPTNRFFFAGGIFGFRFRLLYKELEGLPLGLSLSKGIGKLIGGAHQDHVSVLVLVADLGVLAGRRTKQLDDESLELTVQVCFVINKEKCPSDIPSIDNLYVALILSHVFTACSLGFVRGVSFRILPPRAGAPFC
mmetsp:Transcript_6671/g.12602  ORF Transcript_6671/g.12602 Transcript_6671/m.12602 type:complete len:244 (-) Transcript_6671:38-769(-)